MNIYRPPKVSVVILNYNKPYFTLDCLASVFESDYSNFEVIVVDNYSEISKFISLKEKLDLSKVILIRTDYNKGYAGGNNIGIRHSVGKYILLLNDDAIIEKSLIGGLVELAEKNSNLGMIGPVIYRYKSHSLWGYPLKILNNSKEVVDVPLVVGAAAMVSRKALEKVGLLDENYFMYQEDWDWCFRFREAGYRTVCATKLLAWHNVQEQNQKSFAPYYAYYSYRNYFLFAAKHCTSKRETIKFLFNRIVWRRGWKLPFVYPFEALKEQKINAARAYFIGIIDGMTFLFRFHVLLQKNDGNKTHNITKDSTKSKPSKEWVDGVF